MNRLHMLVLLAALSGVGAEAPPIVDYTVSPEIKGGALQALDVTIHLNADASGVTRLHLPDSDHGVSSLWRYVQDLTIDGAKTVTLDGPAKRGVTSAPGAPLTIRYRIVSAFDHDPSADDFDNYKPTIRPKWFWGYGEALFVVPEADAGRRARFHWAGPDSYPFASSLERPDSATVSLDELQGSVLLGGPDLVVFDRTAAGAPIRIAEIGRFSFSGSAFADMATRVVSGERQFWGGHEQPFLIALAALTPSSRVKSMQGEGRESAFAIMAGADTPFPDLRSILAHEYFHTWNPRRLGGLPDDETQRASYWFSEGFTDFYARRLLLRMGLYNSAAFADAWNEALRAYGASSVRTEPGVRVVKDFWRDPEVEKLPYERGAILAAIFDEKLRRLSGGRVDLDDVMHAVRDRAAKAGAASPKAADLFIETTRGLGLDPRPEIAAIVERGEPAVLPAGVFGACLPVKTLTIPAFDRGFDIEATLLQQRMAGVKANSPAYAAGLRDGVPLAKIIGGVYGDSRAPYRVVVREDGADRLIAFKPEGRTTITFQEVQPTAGLSNAAACLRSAMGGPPIEP